MGIQNKDGALYFATGIDNTGMYEGRREAMGIIKAMTGEISSFDVFGGIGISAGVAFAKAAKDAYDFEKAFQSSMLEITTISDTVANSLDSYQDKIIGLSKDIPIQANDAAKALYEIISAGHDGADSMKILEASAKGAIGGITDTATSSDIITTLMNSYNLSANDANMITDQLFTTVKLGKTTFTELGQSIAQAAPIAASYGIEMDQLLAAVSSLTKQGVKTPQAMTQIRASIIGVSKVLGDGAYDGQTYQEALQKVYDMSGGSAAKLRELMPEIEGVNGLLAMTGKNASGAASDLVDTNNSLGATDAAYKKMRTSVENQMTLLRNNITAMMRPMGESMLKSVSEVAEKMNSAFDSGDIEGSLDTLKTLIILTSGALVAYKAATMESAKGVTAETIAHTMSANIKKEYHALIGEGLIQKEKERVSQEAYTASLEASLTTEQQAKLSKLDLKQGSVEYANALSDIATQEKKNAESQVESLSNAISKNKERLAGAQENLDMAKEATSAAKAEFDAAFQSNDLASVEVAQTKLNSAAKREESAATNVSTISKKIRNQETKLSAANNALESATTVVDTATKAADTAATNVLTTAKMRLTLATKTLWATISANPIGALLTVISLAATAFFAFSDGTEKSKTALESFDEAQEKTKSNVESWSNTLNDSNESERKRTEALENLKRVLPEVYSHITLANIADKDRNKTLKETNTILDERAKKELEMGIAVKKAQIAKINNNPEESVSTTSDMGKSSGRIKYLSENQVAEINRLTNELKPLLNKYEQVTDAAKKLAEQKLTRDERIALRTKELETLNMKIDEVSNKIKTANNLKLNFGGGNWGGGSFSFDQLSLDKLQAEKEQKEKAIKAEEKAKEQEKSNKRKELTDKEKDAAQKRKGILEDIAHTALGVELKLQQERVALMSEGREKALAQVEQEHKDRIQAIEKEELDLKKKYQSVKKSIPIKITQEFEERKDVAKQSTDVKKSMVNKEYDQKDLDFNKELTAVFLSEEEKKKQAIIDKYDAMRKAANESYEAELRNINLTKIATEAEQAKADAAKSKDKKMDMIDGAQSFEEKTDKTNTYNSLLSQLSDFKSKEYTLTREWDEKIATATTSGNGELVDSLITEKEKALRELNAQMLMQSQEWVRLFGDMDTLTIAEMDKLIHSIESKLNSADLKLNPADLKALSTQLNEAKQKVAASSPFKSLSNSMGDLKTSLKNLHDAEKKGLTGEALDKYKGAVQNASKNVKISIGSIKDAYGKVSDVMKSAGDLIGMVDEGLGETVNNAVAMGDAVMNVGDVVADAVIGFATGMNTMETASVILLVIKAVLMAVMAAIKLFNNDKSHEKKIKEQQEVVDNLKNAYDNLGKAIENAFSSDKVNLLDKQSENLRQQNSAIRRQINEEQDKKDTDSDKIRDWQKSISDNLAQIEANSTKLRVEAIMGTEIRTAIEDFASAYADAWAAGDKAAGNSAKTVKNLIRKSIIEMLKMELQPEVTKFMTFLSEAMKDGIISPIEQQSIDDYERRLENIADASLKGKEKWLEDEDKMKDKTKGVTGKLQAEMTEGTASELVGLWNMTAMDIRALKELSAEHFELWKTFKLDVISILEETKKIENNTRRTADNTDKLDDGLKNIKEELVEIKKNTKSYNGRG